MANFCSGVKVRLFGGAAGSMSSSVTFSFWARSIKGVELVKVMVSVLPVSPWREERLRQVSHVSLTDRAINRTHIEQHKAQLQAALADMASVDELTGCAVRRVLRQRMEEEIARSVRNRSPLSLLMIDVDQFKSVNDTFGHVVGCLLYISPSPRDGLLSRM